jgi:hypothetical protein
VLKGGGLYAKLFARLSKKESKRLADELPFGLEVHPSMPAIAHFLHKPDECSLRAAKDAVGDGNLLAYIPALNEDVSSQGERVQRVQLTFEEFSCVYGTAQAIKLLARSQYFRETTEGYTPLIFCAFSGNSRTAEALIEAGVDVNGVDAESGLTALHAAVSGNYYELVETLLQKGANPNLRSYDKRTPLFFAQRSDIIDLLVRYNADVNAVDSQGITTLDKFVQDGNERLVKAIAIHGGTSSGKQLFADQSAQSTYQVGYGAVLPVKRLFSVR